MIACVLSNQKLRDGTPSGLPLPRSVARAVPPPHGPTAWPPIAARPAEWPLSPGRGCESKIPKNMEVWMGKSERNIGQSTLNGESWRFIAGKIIELIGWVSGKPCLMTRRLMLLGGSFQFLVLGHNPSYNWTKPTTWDESLGSSLQIWVQRRHT